MIDESTSPPMRVLLQAAREHVVSLDPGLRPYVGEGLIDSDGVLLSAWCARPNPEARDRFEDDTAFEAFVNKIRFSLCASSALYAAPLEVQLAHALLLADMVAAMARQRGRRVTVIISIDVGDPDSDPAIAPDVVFRFYSHHPGEAAWVEEPESATEPLLVRRYV